MDGHDSGLVAEITRLGIAHRIVTRFTSFVAVDTSRVVGDGRPGTVAQPVEIPEAVDVTMAAPMAAARAPARMMMAPAGR